MNTRPDLDTSGNRCAKLDTRYPTRLSAKVLTSRMATSNYSKYIVQFTLCDEKFLKIAARLIAWLPIAFFHQIRLKIYRSFANPHR